MWISLPPEAAFDCFMLLILICHYPYPARERDGKGREPQGGFWHCMERRFD